MHDVLLIKRCKEGDSEALHCIYDRHRERLLVIAMTLTGNINTAEDILHDVFLNFVQRLDRFKLTGTLKGFLAVCVANQARNHLKSVKVRQGQDIDQVKIETSPQRGPVRTAMINEQLALLSQAMIQLPIEQRTVIALHLHADLTFRAIAQQLDSSVPTIKSRYRYGLTKLRSILREEVTS
ncbi:RNA polymerase sigma factor [Planctomycetota bacterium]